MLGECSTTPLGKEADVGVKGEALCEKKRAKPFNLKTRAKLQKERANPPVQPPSYHLWVALKLEGGWAILVRVPFTASAR